VRLPEVFVRNITGAFPERGAGWLATLPDLLARYAERWQLRLGEPFPLTYNYVVAATRADGQPAVLKLGPPPVPGVAPSDYGHEFPALRAAAGHGMVTLLEYDQDGGAALLARIRPGTPLTELVLSGRDEQATAIAVAVMRRIHAVPAGAHPFPTLSAWGGAYQRGCPPGIPYDVFDRGARLYRELLADAAPAVLLHGDLHHDNILRGPTCSSESGESDGWWAIDPKGVLGEPAYEAAALLRNPYPGLLHLDDPARVVRRRVDQLAEGLDVPRERIRAWGYAQTVLAAVWDAEDGHQPGDTLLRADLMRP